MVTKKSVMSRESHGKEEEMPSCTKFLNSIKRFHDVSSFSLINPLYICIIIYPPSHPPATTWSEVPLRGLRHMQIPFAIFKKKYSLQKNLVFV